MKGWLGNLRRNKGFLNVAFWDLPGQRKDQPHTQHGGAEARLKATGRYLWVTMATAAGAKGSQRMLKTFFSPPSSFKGPAFFLQGREK